MSLAEAIDNLNVWKRDGERAPNKPLLLLLALGRYAGHLPRSVTFKELEPKLRDLLIEFGPTRQSQHPEYPFWRLQNDGIGEASAAAPLRVRASNSDPTVTSLRETNATGKLTNSVEAELDANPNLLVEVSRRILNDHFPTSLHEEIALSVGLDLSGGSSANSARDAKFRDAVLMAYGYRCAICEYDVRIGNHLIGLEAAHIQWHQATGPDEVSNGLALCANHHKLLDYGAITLDDDRIIIASQRMTGSAHFDNFVMSLHGKGLRDPQEQSHKANPKYLSWHRLNVFKAPAKPMGW